VLGPAAVDVIEQGRQGGGLAGACGTGDQDQTPGTAAGFLHHRREFQALETGDAAAQGPQAGGIAAPLPVNVDPEPRDPLQPIGAVQLPGLLQLFALGVVDQRKDQTVAEVFTEPLLAHRLEGSAEAAVGGLACRQMQVAAAPIHQFLHQLLDLELHRRRAADPCPQSVNGQGRWQCRR